MLCWAEEGFRTGCGLERVALWFARATESRSIYRAQEFVAIPNERTLRQEREAVVPDPLCIVWGCRYARATDSVLFLVHTHVARDPSFSRLDELAERRMAPHIMRLTEKDVFGTVVVAESGCSAKLWNTLDGKLSTAFIEIEP